MMFGQSYDKISHNVFGLGEEADLTAQKMIEAQMFNQLIQRHSSTSAAFLPNPCYVVVFFFIFCGRAKTIFIENQQVAK